jgi:hypothetical protein
MEHTSAPTASEMVAMAGVKPAHVTGRFGVVGRRGTDCWNRNPGEAVGSSQWIFVRGLIGALAVIASVGCDRRAEMTREDAYSRQLSLDVAAIVGAW